MISIAEDRNDERLLLSIRGHALLACEAKYHPSTAAPQMTLNCFNDNVSVSRTINLVPYHFQVVHDTHRSKMCLDESMLEQPSYGFHHSYCKICNLV